jgi:AcrR family transcriptional regulator
VISHRPDLLKDEKLPPEPRQRRSHEKRARLKDSALALFGSRGYERTSISDIARRAHLATGSFYQHYRSKRQLLLALMDDLLAAMAGLPLRPDPAADVRTSLRNILARGFSAERRYLKAYRAWREAALYDPALAQSEMEIRQWTTQRIATLLMRLQQWPGARPGVNIPAMAQVIDTMCWSLLERHPDVSPDQLHAVADAALDMIYHAMFLDSANEPHPSGAGAFTGDG